jgi:hypothetical protein
VFGLELREVLHVLLVCISFAVCRQLNVVSLFGSIRLGLKWLFTSRIQLLPPVSDKLGYLREREVLVFDLFAYLVGKDDVG